MVAIFLQFICLVPCENFKTSQPSRFSKSQYFREVAKLARLHRLHTSSNNSHEFEWSFDLVQPSIFSERISKYFDRMWNELWNCCHWLLWRSLSEGSQMMGTTYGTIRVEPCFRGIFHNLVAKTAAFCLWSPRSCSRLNSRFLWPIPTTDTGECRQVNRAIIKVVENQASVMAPAAPPVYGNKESLPILAIKTAAICIWNISIVC
jgi:hypothetical protein